MLDAIPSSTAAGAGRAVRQSGPRWPARLLRGFALLLILLGALTLIDGAVTLLWQEPITALLATLRQDHLSSALSKVEHAPPTAVEQRALAGLSDERQRIAYLADDFARRSGGGGAVGRITIPQIGASYVVVKGTGTEELKSGPGIDGRTHFPGVAGTTLIAGHRTTYLAPFRHINSLSAGNHITLSMPYAHFTYTVTGRRVVAPGDVEAAIANVGYPRLVLSACTPLFSAAKRLLVYARLTRTVPAGAARWLPGGVVPVPIEVDARKPRPLPAMLESLDPDRVAPLV